MLENQKKAVDVVLWYQDDVEPVSLNVYAIDTFPLLNIIQSTTHFDKTQQSLLKRLKLEDNQTILWYRFDRNDWVTDSLTRDFPIVKGQPLLLRKDGVSALHLPGFDRYKEGGADTGVLRRVSRRVSAKSSKRVYDEMEYAKDVIDGFHAHDENMRLHKRARTCSERNSSMNEGYDMDYALRACQEWEKVEARKAECGRDMRHCQAPLSNHFVENSTPQLLSSPIQLPSSPDLYAEAYKADWPEYASIPKSPFPSCFPEEEEELGPDLDETVAQFKKHVSKYQFTIRPDASLPLSSLSNNGPVNAERAELKANGRVYVGHCHGGWPTGMHVTDVLTAFDLMDLRKRTAKTDKASLDVQTLLNVVFNTATTGVKVTRRQWNKQCEVWAAASNEEKQNARGQFAEKPWCEWRVSTNAWKNLQEKWNGKH